MKGNNQVRQTQPRQSQLPYTYRRNLNSKTFLVSNILQLVYNWQSGKKLKRSLTKLLLALVLVANPVAVLATDFHADVQAGNAAEMAACHSADQQSKLHAPTQRDSTDCEMPCCQEVSCLYQSTCVIHFSSALMAQQASRLYLTIGHSDWASLITAIPDRELPPDNPPPIHV